MVKTLRLFQPRKMIVTRPRERRGNRHERGYDYEWTKMSAAHLRKNPLCAECEHHGRVNRAVLVDHKVPIRLSAELRLDKRNHWGLCEFCHNGMKRRMEAYAERVGKVDLLILWCDDVSKRPDALQMRQHRSKEEMIV